jgi:tetratricopeptide (TPR) repeat protein
MTKAVLEAESEGEAQRTTAAVPSPALAVPASLHASLMARLDRLGAAKEVAQIGSAIGREFSHPLLAAVVNKPEPELRSALDRLTAAGLLFRQGVPPRASYLFKHALVGQAATLVFALFWASWHHMLYGHYAEAQSLLDELAALVDEKDATLFWKATETVLRGVLFALTGKASDAVRAITSGMTSLRSTGAALYEPWHLSHLAMAYTELGQPDNARRCIDDAINKVERSKEKWCETEVHRIAGAIALKSVAPDTEKAEKHFERALRVAHQQQQKSYELRAAISLARLWRDEGMVSEARELLAPVYGWFTEGFETRDLKEAKALLEELAS